MGAREQSFLRQSPSDGRLCAVSAGRWIDLTPGLYHYASKEHGLELRADFAPDHIARLMAPLPPSAFLFGLTSVHWREAWKYGERAFRYCNHDVGHAIGSARLAAATLGWNMALLDGVDQNSIAMLLGTHRSDDFRDVEPEHPDCLAVIWPDGNVTSDPQDLPLFLDQALVKDLAGGPWHGKANELSREHGVHWDVIDEVADASWKIVDEQLSVRLHRKRASSPDAPPVSRTTHEAGNDHQTAPQCGLLRRENLHLRRDVLPDVAPSDTPRRSSAIGSAASVGRIALGSGDPSDAIRASCRGIAARALCVSA